MRTVEAYAEFDLCGPLPSGVTVLEASAGTGKTYTIAALAARYVAEGTPLERLLLITFTRMATGELRDRVRERLVGCEQELSRILAGAPLTTGPDPVVTLLASGSPEEVAAAARPAGARGRRLRRGHDRHHPRLLPGGAGRAQHDRRSRSRDRVRRGRLRPARGGARRPVRPAVRRRAAARGSPGPRRCRSRARRCSTRWPSSSRRTSPRTAPRRCATAWPRWCGTSSSSESAGSRS